VEGEKPEECWLEKWSQEALQQGVRALDGLRTGVERAIAALGSGFLNPHNPVLLAKLRDGGEGGLDKQDYYRQLLRMVYRLLFLFTAEDRGLLLDPRASEAAAQTYAAYYSTDRLRHLAERRRGSRHTDLYESLRLVMQNLGGDGCPELGLPALGSMLFADESVADLLGCRLANRDLLDAVRHLAFTSDGRSLRPIDFRNLGAEELGSVYESLLEMTPILEREAATFELKVVSGSERKTTGSYYTPSSLIQCLLDTALDPVVDERLAEATKGVQGMEERREAAQAALLDLKVCDPACGSGHFLIAAAHRLARRLAAVRTGDDEPAPEATRHALRDVIGHCIYGVDINPMSVELCKVNLWMEALEPGKPLSFLDHRIQCGNSLLGATPALLREGIPDAAFSAIEGDDKKVCSELKKRNKKERASKQSALFDVSDTETQARSLRTQVLGIDAVDDSTTGGVNEKARRFEAYRSSREFDSAKLIADAWCAAFTWVKKGNGVPPITEERYQYITQDPDAVSESTRAAIDWQARHYGFFHWHLAFPDVFEIPPDAGSPDNTFLGWSGGFDVVLGNPPWDTLSPDQREFFGRWVSGLRSMAPAEQTEVIASLLNDPRIAATWAEHRRDLLALVHFLKNSGSFTLFAPGNLGKGDFNVYRMFVENALRRVAPGARASQVVPAGLYGGANASGIRRFMLDENQWEFLVGCENKGSVFFPGVHPQTWFAVYTAKRGGWTSDFRVAFGVDSLEKARRAPQDAMRLDADLVRQLSPETYAVPDLQSTSDLSTTQKMYSACPAFGMKIAGTPIRHYLREVDMGTDRGLFTTDSEGLPVYEGRMIDQFDHRAKTYDSGHGNSAIWIERSFGDPAKAIVPQWRVLREKIPKKLGDRCDRYRVGFGDVANPRNVRSFVSTLIPPSVICGHKVPTLDFGEGNEWSYLPWLAVANSFAMDWLARARLTSPQMAFSLLDALPFPRPALDDSFVTSVAETVLRLICTSAEMTGFWNIMAGYGLCSLVPLDEIPGSALLDPQERALAKARLDALVAKDVFDLSREELSDVLDTFGVLQRREIKERGEYVTKGLVLESFDAISA